LIASLATIVGSNRKRPLTHKGCKIQTAPIQPSTLDSLYLEITCPHHAGTPPAQRYEHFLAMEV